MAGWQQLFWDNQLVSQIAADSEHKEVAHHQFNLLHKGEELQCSLQARVVWQPFFIEYFASLGDQVIAQGQRNSKDIERQTPTITPQAEKRFSLVGLLSLGMKALKSAKVIKVALASASLAAYSWLFSVQFALALLVCLVFHEYGHIRAMKYFGLKTKGIYLIPFIGGLAVTDERLNTRWQDVVISIMGPMFGLFLSLIFMLAYWLTGEAFFAGLSVFNAFLNLFNLLPILPLDGGHILKSISFSMNGMLGICLCTLAVIGGIILSYSLSLSLLGFLLLMGMLDIILEWKSRHNSHLLPLDRYGQVVSSIWYVALVASLVAIIWYFGSSGDQVLGLPLILLGS